MDPPDVSRVGLPPASDGRFGTGRRHRRPSGERPPLPHHLGRSGRFWLTKTCQPGDAPEVVPAPDEAGARVFDAPTSLDPFQGTRSVVFGGGCVRYDHHFASGVPASLSLRADDAFSFVPRADVVAAVRDEFHQTLCGADAPPCEDPS